MKKAKNQKAQSGKYSRVGNNIYVDGTTYRVRVSVGGIRRSKNFSSLKEAYAYRREMLKEQENSY